MLTLTCYRSGELEIVDDRRRRVRLGQPAANRLIMAARMHSPVEFIEMLPRLVPDAEIEGRLAALLEASQGSERWSLKEAFARLVTVTPGYSPSDPEEVAERVTIGPDA